MGFHRLVYEAIDLGDEAGPVELKADVGRDLDQFASVGQHFRRKADSGGERNLKGVYQPSGEGDVLDGAQRESSWRALPSVVDARDIKARQQVINPLIVGGSCNAGDADVVVWQ